MLSFQLLIMPQVSKHTPRYLPTSDVLKNFPSQRGQQHTESQDTHGTAQNTPAVCTAVQQSPVCRSLIPHSTLPAKSTG